MTHKCVCVCLLERFFIGCNKCLQFMEKSSVFNEMEYLVNGAGIT